MTDFALARRNMIDGQLRPNRVTNAQLLAAIGELPRERFLPEATRSVAYADDDVPLGNGRYLMEPMILARLIQTLQAQPEDRAMVIASGPGYGAALLARLVHSVVAVESDPKLLVAAEQTAKELGITGIQRTVGKLDQGAPASAPYDVILIEGAVRVVPQAIFDQLAEGGRLTTVVAGPPGALGVAQLFMKEGGMASGRPLFDAGTPSLPGFAPPPVFTF
jgi:protein-L-isoaspartate(D-aspartate) O-methyltransferase